MFPMSETVSRQLSGLGVQPSRQRVNRGVRQNRREHGGMQGLTSRGAIMNYSKSLEGLLVFLQPLHC